MSKSESQHQTTIMVNGVEFVWQTDDSLLIVSVPQRRYCRVENRDAIDLLDWLRDKLERAKNDR